MPLCFFKPLFILILHFCYNDSRHAIDVEPGLTTFGPRRMPPTDAEHAAVDRIFRFFQESYMVEEIIGGGIYILVENSTIARELWLRIHRDGFCVGWAGNEEDLRGFHVAQFRVLISMPSLATRFSEDFIGLVLQFAGGQQDVEHLSYCPRLFVSEGVDWDL